MSPRRPVKPVHSVFSGRFPSICLIVLASLAAPGLPWDAPGLRAQPTAVFDGSKARVNLANKLRMLNERIAAAGCRIQGGFGGAAALDTLRTARGDFATILDGLENGDTGLGIPKAESRSRVIRALGSLRETWAPVNAAVDGMLAGQDLAGNGRTIAEGLAPLTEGTDILASEVTAAYSNPAELLQRDAFAIGVAGRQRMLSQELSREVCGLAAGVPLLGNSDSLAGTADSFDKALSALVNGLPEAGVAPPPTEVIERQLGQVQDIWASRKPLIDGLAGQATASGDAVQQISAFADDLLLEMDNAVTLYMLSTPGQEDVYRVPLRAYAENVLSQWLVNPDLVAAVKAQNAAHGTLGQAEIDTLDQQWRAEEGAGGGPLIGEMMARPVSQWLAAQQAATAGFVTEVFAMDNKGLNVAQSAVTSDYWQGDEAKWQETYGNGSGAIHISEVEYDDSTGAFQSQVSIPIRDPASGEMLGAITFGINVQSLL